jgi:phosphoribosyl-AMP cyclohydrolase
MSQNSNIEESVEFTPKFDAQGLIPAIAQDHLSGDILMLAYMNADALQKTLESGEAVYWSRSRQSLWKKGETSGHIQKVRDILIDCDQDALVLKIEQVGNAACHTGRWSCFYRKLRSSGENLNLNFTKSE